MKKKVLFALIALFSFLSSWATDVTVGGYTVTIATQYVALTDATTGVDAPAVTAIKSGDATIDATFICVLDANKNKVDGKIKATGTYYRLYNFTVENTQKVMKVPFCVFDPATTAIDKEFIYNEDTYEDSKDDGVYKAYLAVSPWSYVWYDADSDGYCWYPTATSDEGKNTEWEQLKENDDDDMYTHHWNALWYDYPSNKLWEDFPTFGIVKPTSGSGIVAVYKNGAYLGKIDFNAENAPKYFLASVKEFWPARADGYTLPWPGEQGYAAPASLAEAYGEFDSDYMMFYQVPALQGSVENATILAGDDVTISCNNLPYNGAVQYPTFSGENFNATVTYTPATASEAITLVEGRDFTPVYEVANDDYKSADEHHFTVNFIGEYAGSKDATYNITKAHVNINLAYIYKTYGEADPALPANATPEQLAAYTNKLGFEIDASTPLKGTDVKSDIAKYLIFTRATGEENEGEDVREYDYYYEKTADFADNCNYTVSFLQTKSLLIIQPKAVTIDVTPVYKEYHKTVELKYDAEALKAQLVEADKAKASGTPGATDLITSITWEGAGTDAGEAVNATIEGTGADAHVVFTGNAGYPMTATAAIVPATKKSNYNVTVAIPEQGFAIVPTTTANLTVEVPATEANGAVQVDGEWMFVYNGTFQKPEPIVKDGTVELTKGTDYTVAYEDNQDAGTAKCKVTLTGSYSSTLNQTANFTINKADLVVKPVSSTDADEDNWRVAYEGFKAREASATDATTTPETESTEYGRGTGHAYFSVDPENISVVKGEEIEQDVYVLNIQLPTGVTAITAKNYNVTIGDALLALNNKPVLRVRPAENQPGKVYDGNEPTAEELAALAIEVEEAVSDGYREATDEQKAALKILGTPVYTITKAPGVNVGRYRLTVTGPAVLKDYNVEYDNTHGNNSSRNYPITPAAYFIVVNNDPAKLGTASKTYGSADPSFTLTAATRTGEGTAASPYVYTAAEGVTVPTTVRAVHLNNYNGADDAGNHDILVQRNTGSNNRPNWQAFANWTVGNYIFTSVNGVLNIAKKAVIFKAENKSKVYGTADPALTISPDPVVTDLYSEALSKTNGVYNAFNITREEGDAVGTYTITLEVKDTDPATPGLQAHNSLRNFDVTVQNGTFTIDQATYFVRANDQWIHFYNEINPLDVTIDLPGGVTLRWQKAGINESADATAAREANNALIEALGSLEVLPGKDAIGANKDAYKWNAKDNDNYALAKGEAGSKTIPATAHTREYVYTDGFCNGYLTVYPLEYIPLENAELAELLGKEADAAGAQPSLLQKVLEAHKGLTIPVKMPARNLVADEWYTFVLPFPVKPSELFDRDYFGYGALEILDAEKSKGNNVVFSLQMNKIPANTPFILKVENEVSATKMNAIWFNGKDKQGVTIDNSINYLTENPTTGAEGNVQFVGLYYDKKGFTADQRYNAKVGVDPRGFYAGGDKSGSIVVKRTNAYLQFPSAVASANARIFIEEENGTLTEITGVEAGAEVTDGEGWYTITGVKLDAEPTTSGTYIFNGKKVFIQK